LFKGDRTFTPLKVGRSASDPRVLDLQAFVFSTQAALTAFSPPARLSTTPQDSYPGMEGDAAVSQTAGLLAPGPPNLSLSPSLNLSGGRWGFFQPMWVADFFVTHPAVDH